MNFPLYASIVLLGITLVMFAAFAAVTWLGAHTPPDDPDWEDGSP